MDYYLATYGDRGWGCGYRYFIIYLLCMTAKSIIYYPVLRMNKYLKYTLNFKHYSLNSLPTNKSYRLFLYKQSFIVELVFILYCCKFNSVWFLIIFVQQRCVGQPFWSSPLDLRLYGRVSHVRSLRTTWSKYFIRRRVFYIFKYVISFVCPLCYFVIHSVLWNFIRLLLTYQTWFLWKINEFLITEYQLSTIRHIFIFSKIYKTIEANIDYYPIQFSIRKLHRKFWIAYVLV